MEEQEATLVRISERLQQLLVPVEPPLAYVRLSLIHISEPTRPY